MTLRPVFTYSACFLTAALMGLAAEESLAAPQVFWASDPVRPDETVLLQGSDFGSAAIVEATRLDDGQATAPAGVVKVKEWTRVPVLQASDCSLKFVVPADWKVGVFACRVTAGGATSAPVLVNAPDAWWMQGDRGASATPGGWLRIFGKSLAFAHRSVGEAGEKSNSALREAVEDGNAVFQRAIPLRNPPSSQRFAPRRLRNSIVRLTPQQGTPVDIKPDTEDCYALCVALPADLKPGEYTVNVHNGLGGNAAWGKAGTLQVESPATWPTATFSVLEPYGKDAVQQMRKTLNKYSPVPDRTAGIQAALKKARQNGGGIVYFPAGRYGIKGDLDVPPRTVLKGEGMGLVVLWWGTGRFNLDGGSEEGLEAGKERAKMPGTLIHGSEFGLEEMSLYLPLAYETAISGGERFRMRKVRVRVDHHWAMDGRKRPEGLVAYLGNNAEVTDCDILAKGTGLVPGRYCLISRNRIMAGKTNCTLGGSEQAIVEDNHFVSLYPTAYENIAGSGRNIYFARNLQESFHVHQADYSFTFDAGDGAYFGKLAAVHGTQLALAEDPSYPNWAAEKSGLWRKSIVVISDGRGAGQWRRVVSNHGRQWEIDRPFDCPPDGTSLVTIVPMNGRVLVIGNRFEDANWVNASYGTAIDVIFAENRLYRCAQLLNYGCQTDQAFQPSWYVQFLDNQLWEGQTSIDTTGSVRDRAKFPCPITRCTINRGNLLGGDNSGDISVSGCTRDVIVEGCVLRFPTSQIRVSSDPKDVLLRKNAVQQQ